jgi:hypothetical protein
LLWRSDFGFREAPLFELRRAARSIGRELRRVFRLD